MTETYVYLNTSFCKQRPESGESTGISFLESRYKILETWKYWVFYLNVCALVSEMKWERDFASWIQREVGGGAGHEAIHPRLLSLSRIFQRAFPFSFCEAIFSIIITWSQISNSFEFVKATLLLMEEYRSLQRIVCPH